MKQNHKKPLLTISLLISNRPETVPRCLDSLLPIMKAIPSELILVDTSKSPEIHELLLKYTDKVYEFEWCKDFAKARNVGLKKAKGEWFMFMDDDEWFVDTEDLIRFFKSGEYKQYGFANYQIRNFFDTKFISYSDGTVTRLFKLEKDSAFHSKIHEYYAPVRGNKKYLNSTVYHTGYMYATEEQRRAHFERNASLLLEMIKEEPEALRWPMQLAQEYCAMHEWETLERFCKKELKTLNRDFSEEKRGLFATICAAYAHALSGQGKYEKANKFCLEKIQDERSIEYLKALLHYVKAENHFVLKEWKQAKVHIEAFLKLEEYLKQEDSIFKAQKSILLAGIAFDEGRVAQAYSTLICCDLKEGLTESLHKYYDYLGWEQKNIHVHVDAEQHLVDAMAEMEYDPIFVRVATDGFRNRGLAMYMAYAAKRWDENEEAFRKIMHIFSQADVEDAYIWFARICMADWENNGDKVGELIDSYFNASSNVLQIPRRLQDIAEKYGVDLQQYWKLIDADTWKSSVSHYVQYTEKEELDKTTEHIERIFSKEDWRYQFYYLYLLEKAAKANEEGYDAQKIEKWVTAKFAFFEKYYREDVELTSDIVTLYETMLRAKENLFSKDIRSDEIEQTFYEYMVGTLEYYLCLFKDAAFEGEMELLPSEVRAAVLLNNFFGRDETDWEMRLALLREVLAVCPELGERVKEFAQHIGQKHQEKKSTNASVELVQMIGVMKVKIRQLIAQGMKKEALEIITQVRALAPEDQELTEMEKEAWM